MIELRQLDVAFLVPGLNPPQGLVLIFMARRANKSGSYWEAQTTLADDTGLSLSTVRRSISDLLELCMLEEGNRGRLRTKRYRALDQWMMPT